MAAEAHQKTLAEHPEVMRKHHFDAASTWKLYHDSVRELDVWKDEFSDQIAAPRRSFPFTTVASASPKCMI